LLIKILCGNKRIILLVGTSAIKIGKIRLIRCVSRFFILPFSLRLRERFFKKYGPTWREAIIRDLFAGLLSNRNEYRYFQEHKDDRVMPTISQFLLGSVVVQLRGQPISGEEIIKEFPQYQSDAYRKADICTSTQFCRHPDGTIKIVDYGEPTTISLLQETSN